MFLFSKSIGKKLDSIKRWLMFKKQGKKNLIPNSTVGEEYSQHKSREAFFLTFGTAEKNG